MNGTIKRNNFRGVKKDVLEKQMSLVIEHMTIEELYKEVLYEILHNVGCDATVEIGRLPLLAYVQDAFKISNEKHQEFLTEAESKQPPDILLNVEVIEARDLMPKDPNGLSDPFVTMYLMSNKTLRYNTSVKSGTLNPQWEEHFSLPIVNDANDDILCLEVWDFDPAETVKEKVSKIFDIKGVKGLRKLMKEIAITVSTGKHDDELIGKAFIPLKTIPSSGMVMWYSLDKKSKTSIKRGVIRVNLKFSSEKNVQVATQEHRHLLKILLLHELENSKVAPFWWAGNFGSQAEAIIIQHAAQSGLNENSINISQWIVYCGIHSEYSLSYVLFNNLLDKLKKPLELNLFSSDDYKLFWDGVRKILPPCYNFIRKIRKKSAGDKNILRLLKEMLTLMSKLTQLSVTSPIDLFPANQYGWLERESDTNFSIKEVLVLAINIGASDWFNDIIENNDISDPKGDKLQVLIRVIQLARSDLQRSIEYFDKCFSETIYFAYSKLLYIFYEKKLCNYAEPIILDTCKSLKRLNYNGSGLGSRVTLTDDKSDGTKTNGTDTKEEPLAMGTTLFELYLVLQRFLALGQGLCPADWSSFSIANFHSWFFAGVTQWLDIAVFKALTRIEKAVELDKLVPIDSTVKYSSSAIDTLAIFYQIKVFWEQLDWPDPEGSYTFIAKIVDDICRCCVFYADKMSYKVDGFGEVTSVYENEFLVTIEWCLAINNIDHIKQNLKSFVTELGADDILKKLSEIRSPAEAERCEETLHNVIENAVDTITNKIIELMEFVVKKMRPSISHYLLEGAELYQQDCSAMERVMMYLEKNFSTLHSNLSENNFTRILDVIWFELSELLLNIINTNIEKRRPPNFFSNLGKCLNLMIEAFKQDNTNSKCNETLERVQYLLQLHGFETSELIHQHFIERWQEQQCLTESPFGILSVRAVFGESSIKIEIINARNLLPMDTNGSADSFVKISLLPENLFAGTIRPKTKTHNKNLFPLYEEMFTIILTPEQRSCKNGLVVFDVKDKDMFSNQYLAEAFLHFSEISESGDISTLPQNHLKLSRPTKLEGEPIKSLEYRQGDKQAKEFLKKQKQKIGLPH